MLGGDTERVGRGTSLAGAVVTPHPVRTNGNPPRTAHQRTRLGAGRFVVRPRKFTRFGEDHRGPFDSRARHRGACYMTHGRGEKAGGGRTTPSDGAAEKKRTRNTA